MESKAGKETAPGLLSSDALEPPDLKVALKREREEHQHLLAESYAAVMDLTKQLQLSEQNWGREKIELLERVGQEGALWGQKTRADHTSPEGKMLDVANGTTSPRSKSTSELDMSDVNGTLSQEEKDLLAILPPLLIGPELSDLTRKNWIYLANEDTPEVAGSCNKTWDGPSRPRGPEPDRCVRRSRTAPDRTGIRLYYSPPTVRRADHQGHTQGGAGDSGLGEHRPASPTSPLSPLSPCSSYQQWLSSLSPQHRELLEARPCGGLVANGGAGLAADGLRGLAMTEISANLSDDMKEMTNCVRQAIRSSSLERKTCKEPGGQGVGMATRSTQTAAQGVSVGLQTDVPPGPRGAGQHPKAAASSLAVARARHISSSLDKVHGRIDRPCCSPKYGSPKLQRRVSSGSTSRLDARERSLWSLQQRALGGGGSAWARSTTTRDSPVLSGLNDGLSSLFSVVEHHGSMEALWGATPPARPQPGERVQRDPLGGLGPPSGADEPKPEGVAGLGAGPDSVTRIVNKRFMRHAAREENVAAPGGATLEDASCDCSAQSLTPCFARQSRSTIRHCKHRPQDSLSANEERADSCNE